MTDAGLLLLAIGVFFLSGYIVLGFIPIKGLKIGWTARLGLSFMLGLGAVSLELLAYSVFSVPYTLLTVVIPWAALALLFLLLPPKREAFLGLGGSAGFWKGLGPMDVLLLFVIASQVLYSFSYALLFPITGWDSWQTWFFKARVFFIDGGLKKDFFLTNDLIHADYPLLIPLSVTWVYVAVGRVNEIMARLIYPLQYVSLLAVFYYLVRTATSRRNALLFTAMLSLTHIIMRHAADFPIKIAGVPTLDFVGYADLALCAYFVFAAGFFYLYMKEEKAAYLALASLFLGLGAWTKDEGIAFAVFGSALIAAHIATGRRRASGFFILILMLAITAGPWLLYKWALHIPQENRGELTAGNALAHLGLIPTVLKSFRFVMFENIWAVNFIWYLYPATILLNWRCFFSKPLIFLNIMLFLQFSVYILVYITSSIDLTVHIATSIERVVMHLIPLAMFISAVNLGAFLYRKEAGEKARL